MYRNDKIIKVMIQIIMCSLMFVLTTFAIRYSAETEYKEKIIKNAKQGIVIDKNVTDSSTLFKNSNEPKYTLTLEISYTHKDKKKTTEKTIPVDKETYKKVNINDTFDITTLETIPNTE